jgi:TRAP-type uncharacterized transport system substrate-binding protein
MRALRGIGKVAFSVFLVVLVTPGCPGPEARGPCRLSIATATQGGTYFPVGRQLALALERTPGIRVEEAWARETAGCV